MPAHGPREDSFASCSYEDSFVKGLCEDCVSIARCEGLSPESSSLLALSISGGFLRPSPVRLRGVRAVLYRGGC